MYTYISLSPHIYIYTNGCVYYIDNIMIIYLYIYISFHSSMLDFRLHCPSPCLSRTPK